MSMKIKSFFYVSPAFASGGVLFFTMLFELLYFLFSKNKIKKRDALYFLFVFIILFSIFLIQGQIYGGRVYASVANVEYRELLTIGYYYVVGDINIYYAVKFMSFLAFFFIFYNNYSGKKEKIISLFCCIVFSAFLIQVLIYFSVEFFSGKAVLQLIVGQSDQGAKNYLTSDLYGYRLSVGFYEPSQMSIFLGTVLGCLIHNDYKKSCRIYLYIALVLFFFVTSRSTGILLFSIAAFVFLSFSYHLSILGVALLGLVAFYASQLRVLVSGVDVFRSSYERLHIPSFHDVEFSRFLFGFDFGQVYSFLPFLGLILQVGVLGLFAFLILFKFNLRVFSFFILVYSVSPQLWFSINFISVAFFYVYECRVGK